MTKLEQYNLNNYFSDINVKPNQDYCISEKRGLPIQNI